jgi:lysophospholipase L1-like esterase
MSGGPIAREENRTRMTRRHHGYALLATILCLIVAAAAGIHADRSDDGTAVRRTAAGPRPSHRPAAPASTATWVGSWAASPAAAEPGTETAGLTDRTVRNVVHTSVGGTSARITLSNLYGRGPLTVAHATLALAAGNGPAAVPGTLRRLTFDGDGEVVVPPGQQVTSDPVRIAVPADADVLVTTYSPAEPGPVTVHPHARQVSYAARGDRAGDESGTPFTGRTGSWRYLTALDVLSAEAAGTLVAFGDSLTDGITSTVGANRRWPDVLARRLADAGPDAPRYGVVNHGISGNRVLTDGLGRPADNPSGLNRFARDVLGGANVEVVVIALGVNDILRTPSVTDPEPILDGLRELVDRAHARGIRAVGATLMPFHGHRGYTDAREAVRQRVNAEIRAGRVFDAVADFDEAVRDPYDPRRLLPRYDSGDHLHPSDAGYAAMAAAVEAGSLEGATSARL